MGDLEVRGALGCYGVPWGPWAGCWSRMTITFWHPHALVFLRWGEFPLIRPLNPKSKWGENHPKPFYLHPKSPEETFIE